MYMDTGKDKSLSLTSRVRLGADLLFFPPFPLPYCAIQNVAGEMHGDFKFKWIWRKIVG